MRATTTALIALLTLLGLATGAAAATVHLEGGDRLTGEIVEVKDGKLILAHPHLGEVPIALGGIATLETDRAFSAILASGDLVTGRLMAAGDGRLTLTNDSGAVQLAVTDLRRMKPAPEILAGQGAFEAAMALFEEPEPEPWSGSIEFGGSYVSGNTRRRGFTFAANAVRDLPSDRFEAGFRSTYAEERGERTDNEQVLSLKESLKFDPWYAFVLLSFERDEFENIDLRGILAPGVGRRFVDESYFTLDGELGPALTYTDFRDDTDSDWQLEARLSARAEWKPFSDVVISQTVDFFPSIGDGSEYRIHSETALTKPLSEDLFFKLAVIDDYNSRSKKPLVRNDVKVLASVVFSF